MQMALPEDRVSRLVRRGPVTVVPSTTLRELAAVLVREEVGVALVVQDGNTAGLVSERDVLRAVADGDDVDDDRVEEVMTFDVVRIASDEPVAAAAERMLDGEIRHVLVTDGDRTVGVVSIRDVLAAYGCAAKAAAS